MLTTELSGVVTCCKFLCCCAITGSIPLSTGGLLVSNGISVSVYLLDIFITPGYLRNKSWKPECVLSFNMGWRILVFYPEPEAPMLKLNKNSC
jgi:hypothetical protein